VAAAAAVDKSTTDGDRAAVVEGDESVVVNEMCDELTKVDGSAVDDVSDRDGANDTVFSYNTVSFDQIWRASVSITKEDADIASKPRSGVDAPSQKIHRMCKYPTTNLNRESNWSFNGYVVSSQ